MEEELKRIRRVLSELDMRIIDLADRVASIEEAAGARKVGKARASHGVEFVPRKDPVEFVEIIGTFRAQTAKALLVEFDLDDHRTVEKWVPKSVCQRWCGDTVGEAIELVAAEWWVAKENLGDLVDA